MPLIWAHAEYVKLVRSVADEQVSDLIPEIAERYLRVRKRQPLEVWKRDRMIRAVPPGTRLRIQAPAAFMLHWSKDEWNHASDTRACTTSTGLHFVDIKVGRADRAPPRFTFLWLDDERWEGHGYAVEVRAT
jgi:glucoamylase